MTKHQFKSLQVFRGFAALDVVICLLAGWIYYLVNERPALRLLQNWHNF